MLLVLRRRGVGLSRVSITPMAGSKPTRPRAPRKPTIVDIEAAGVGIRADEALNAVEALGDRSGRQGLSDLDRHRGRDRRRAEVRGRGLAPACSGGSDMTDTPDDLAARENEPLTLTLPAKMWQALVFGGYGLSGESLEREIVGLEALVEMLPMPIGDPSKGGQLIETGGWPREYPLYALRSLLDTLLSNRQTELGRRRARER
jgi:hypothetical protein